MTHMEIAALACERGNASPEQEAQIRSIAPRLGVVLSNPILQNTNGPVGPLGAAVRDAFETIRWRGIRVDTILAEPFDTRLPLLFRPPSDPVDRRGNPIDRADLDAYFAVVFSHAAARPWPERERGTAAWTLYVLRCYEHCWYVGLARDFEARLRRHLDSKDGAHWPKLHRPIAAARFSCLLGRSTVTTDPAYVHLLPLSSNDSSGPLAAENYVTLALMKTFGWRRVRGGSYCSANDQYVERQIREQVRMGEIDRDHLTLFAPPSPPADAAPRDCVAYVAKLRKKR